MYESASISVTFFSNMVAYQGGFEDEDDKDSCIPGLGTTKYRWLLCKCPLCNKCSLPIRENEEIQVGKFVAYCVPCAKEAFEQGTQYSTHAVRGENAFAVSGLKAPFSLFR